MSNLSFIDKQYFEDLFGMQSGYVLDFKNRSFRDFVQSSIQIDIYKQYPDLSKAKILRAIISEYDNKIVGKLLLELLDYKRCHCRVRDDEIDLFMQCVNIGHRLIGKVTNATTNVVHCDKKEDKDIKTDKSFNFSDYHNKLYELTKIGNPQKRGYAFEGYLNGLFDSNGLNPRPSFKISGEQIDGSFVLDGNTYLMEAKWQNEPTTKNDLILFQDKVTNKSDYTRGLFISYSGYAANAIETFVKGKTSRIILMDGLELTRLLELRYDFKDNLRDKIRALAETGNCFYKAD